MTMAEIALRWISHHSLMKREHGDAIIIGASSLNHIEQVRILPELVLFVLTLSNIEPHRPREGPSS